VSTSVTIGRLNASQKRTNRAPFCEPSMSSAPASWLGWLASTPIGMPATCANPVTTLVP
jgi:hypothetical protein